MSLNKGEYIITRDYERNLYSLFWRYYDKVTHRACRFEIETNISREALARVLQSSKDSGALDNNLAYVIVGKGREAVVLVTEL